MDRELKKQQETREILEQIAAGKNVTDTILVPLMQANDFDVTRCVDVLLEMISDPLPGAEVYAHEEQLRAERQQLEEFKHQLELQRRVEEAAAAAAAAHSSRAPAVSDVIAAELRRKEELEARRVEAAEAERRQFAQMRRDLEAEWRARMEEQQRELEARKRQIEEERQRQLAQQLEVVGQQRSKEFQEQVSALLAKRLAAEQARAAEHTHEMAARAAEATAAAASAAVPALVELSCPAAADMGARITVYWEYKVGRPSQSDWIGYYKRSRAPDSRDYYTYQRTGGAERGSLEFVVPAKLGVCELRLFQNNDYKMVARSGPVRVGNAVTVTAVLRDGRIDATVAYADKAAQHSTWDWLGLYRAHDTDNRAYWEGMCAYVTRDTVPFAAPRRPGRYVVRYFQSGSGYSELAQSNIVEIEDHDVLKVSGANSGNGNGAFAVGDTADVVWRVESIAASPKDWVGLYREGEFNPLAALAMQHTHSARPDGSLKFILSRGLLPGRYEFVFVQARSGTPVKRSLPFTVQ